MLAASEETRVRPRDFETLELPRVLEAVAELARSDAGRERVRALRPAPTLEEAEARLDAAADLLALTRETGALPTADVAHLGPALAMAAPAGAALESTRLMEVRDLLLVARSVRVFLRHDFDRFPLLSGLADSLPEVPEVEESLTSVLDERGMVREDASPGLRQARRATRELRGSLEAKLLDVVRDPAHADVVGEQYVTIRNGRYVIPIRTAFAWSFEGVVQDRSHSDETVFVEPLFAVELNNRLLLAAKTEESEERRVRAELTEAVRAHAVELADLEAALAGVDALGAIAAFATRHRCTRPELGTRDVALRDARHPLLLLSERTVVPVDLHLRAEQRGLGITGPNAGGKTVALKTLGLAALMARCGLLVPAGEGARLPWCDPILVDIGDEQSIEHDLSTFTGHADNLAEIARLATRGGLVLLDEPGAGTDPVEGAALAVGVLTDLLERGPLVVFTTHFPQVKTFALAEPALEVSAFAVDPVTGAATYHLDYHAVGQSLALPIARRHGIPARALEIAERLLAGESRDVALAVERLEKSRRELEAARTASEAERARLAGTEAEVATLRDDLRARQRRRWAEDLDASRAFLRDLQAQGRAVLDELRKRPEPQTMRRFVTAAAADVEARAASEVAAPPAAPARPPVVGDTVEVVGRGIRGQLLEIAGERARLLRGGLKFEVPASQLVVVEGAAPARAQPPIRVVTETASDQTGAELNLIGKRAREAIDLLQAFLDRALRVGLSEVRIVHGIGSGALRRAVHEFLGDSPYCSAYRDGDAATEGAGVTIAQLD
jgi:DNA mismatch repair protein MutS2